MKSITAFLAFAAASFSFAAPASATDFSYTGSLNDPNDVLMFNFTVGSPSTIVSHRIFPVAASSATRLPFIEPTSLPKYAV